MTFNDKVQKAQNPQFLDIRMRPIIYFMALSPYTCNQNYVDILFPKEFV